MHSSAELQTSLPRCHTGRRRPHGAPRRCTRRYGRAHALSCLCAAREAVPRPLTGADRPWCPPACSGPVDGAWRPRARPSGTARRSRRSWSWSRPFPPRSAYRAPARGGFPPCHSPAGGAHLKSEASLPAAGSAAEPAPAKFSAGCDAGSPRISCAGSAVEPSGGVWSPHIRGSRELRSAPPPPCCRTRLLQPRGLARPPAAWRAHHLCRAPVLLVTPRRACRTRHLRRRSQRSCGAVRA